MYTIMIVDDEKIVIEGLKIIIRRILPECSIVAAALDGEEGFRFGMELCPDIIITDIKMLREDGLSMIERLRKAGNTSYFIILSAYEDFQFAKQGIKLGVSYYLTKPVEEIELMESVRNIFTEIENLKKKKTDTLTSAEEILEHTDIIQDVCRYIENNFTKQISLKYLADEFNINMYYLSELFKKKTGQNYIDYLIRLRIDKAKELLMIEDMKVSKISEALGYYDAIYFSKIFKKIVGCTPTTYRKQFEKLPSSEKSSRIN